MNFQRATTSTQEHENIVIKFLPWISISMLAAGYAFLIYNLNRVLDLSDEGSYLLQISRPFDDAYRLRDYGALLHPVFSALGESVYALRLFSLVILDLSALFFGITLCVLVSRLGYKLSNAAKASLLCALLSGALVYYFDGLWTPSYNWCNLVGLLIGLGFLCLYSAVGLKGQSPFLGPGRVACLFGIALGGVVTFLGKPTSAAGLALVAILWVAWFPQKRSSRGRLVDTLLAGCLAVALVVLHFTFLSEGIAISIQKYRAGSWAIGTIPSYHLVGLLNPYNFIPEQKKWAWLFVVIIGLYTISLELFRRYHTDRIKTFIAALLAAAATICASYLTVYYKLGYLSPTLVVLTFLYILLYADYQNMPKRLLLLPFFIFMALYFYHFGTTGSYSYSTSKSFVIVLGGMLAGFSLTKPEIRNPLIITSTVIVSILALASMDHFIKAPYRQDAPLMALNSPLQLRKNSAPLYVTKSRQEFMDYFRQAALAHGWHRGMPIINLSFDVCAVPFMLQAKSTSTQIPVRPANMPVKVLIQFYGKGATYQELRRSWILCYGIPEPKPYEFVPTSVLVDLGLPFPQEYELVGSRDNWQLWKPRPEHAAREASKGQ